MPHMYIYNLYILGYSYKYTPYIATHCTFVGAALHAPDLNIIVIVLAPGALQCTEFFDLQIYFHTSNPPSPLLIGLKYFRFIFRFR